MDDDELEQVAFFFAACAVLAPVLQQAAAAFADPSGKRPAKRPRIALPGRWEGKPKPFLEWVAELTNDEVISHFRANKRAFFSLHRTLEKSIFFRRQRANATRSHKSNMKLWSRMRAQAPFAGCDGSAWVSRNPPPKKPGLLHHHGRPEACPFTTQQHMLAAAANAEKCRPWGYISQAEALAITLAFLGHGAAVPFILRCPGVKSITNMYGSIIWPVVEAINGCGEVTATARTDFTDPAVCARLSAGFGAAPRLGVGNGWSGQVGAIDGIDIPMVKPPQKGRSSFGRGVSHPDKQAASPLIDPLASAIESWGADTRRGDGRAGGRKGRRVMVG